MSAPNDLTPEHPQVVVVPAQSLGGASLGQQVKNFRARKAFSSGIIEGLNNKAKVTMRKAYGFRTFKMAELALYYVLGKLPEPNLTHSFY